MPAPDPLEVRLRGEEGAIRRAVLDAAPARPGREPEHREVTEALIAAVLDRFVSLVHSGPTGGQWSHDAVREIGVWYATCRVSRAQALYEFHRTVIEVSRRAWAVAGPFDVGVLLRLAHVFQHDVEPARAALSEGFLIVFAASGTRAVSRRQLAECLFAGRPPALHLVRTANVTIADNYLVLCIRVPVPHVATGDVAEAFGVPGVLVHHDDGLLWVMVPAPRLSVTAPADHVARAFARLGAATGAVVAGAAVADVAGVPDAAEETRGILGTASACERRGAVLAEEIMVERALTGSASAAAALARIIPGLARFPHLPETLDALYAHDLDRSVTAGALHIARRTLTNRLDRIHQLTGFHPASARGVQIFMAALAADRVNRSSGIRPDGDLGAGQELSAT